MKFLLILLAIVSCTIASTEEFTLPISFSELDLNYGYDREEWEGAGKSVVGSVYEFFQGFVDGLNKGKQLNDIDTCVDTFPIVIEDIQKTIKKFRELNWKDIEAILNGVWLLLDNAASLLLLGKPCSNIFTEIGILYELISNIDAERLLNRIKENLMSIIHCFTQAIKQLKLKNYKPTARNLGEIFYYVLLKK